MQCITETIPRNIYKMMEKIGRSIESVPTHVCGLCCLGPLTFHEEAVGALVSLNQGARRADRTAATFRHGLVFSSRPIRVRERVILRVERCDLNWQGAMRVGFTAVPPTGRALPSLAIPDLTDTPGHWAAPVPEACCLPGSELQFWVSCGGSVYFKKDNSRKQRLLEGLDLSRPLWAMIDVYGQTCTVVLLRSEKKTVFGNRKSCPAAPRNTCQTCRRPTLPNAYKFVNQISDDSHDINISPGLAKPFTLDQENTEDCAVCLSQEACIRLQCGHECLCLQCGPRVIQEFGTCPLCRQKIKSLEQTKRPR
ncbi:hypothetical protein DPEC_G00263700 [Dallia pectoralis]|uniref:Uncharacterized protein n=1 Tax=Dallia pectoralis TaxID=75939 RepID=A0ACC2FS97_DALPE|nr:hypothetical protein DPEC_G00263700 [Dallia pectoralis]